MNGTTEYGLAFAQHGDVRAILYADGTGGAMQVKSGGHWRVARPGDVCYSTVIELVRDACHADLELARKEVHQ